MSIYEIQWDSMGFNEILQEMLIIDKLMYVQRIL